MELPRRALLGRRCLGRARLAPAAARHGGQPRHNGAIQGRRERGPWAVTVGPGGTAGEQGTERAV